jgi:hypothetical protein
LNPVTNLIAIAIPTEVVPTVVDTVDRPSETVIDGVEVVRRPVLNSHALNEVAL